MAPRTEDSCDRTNKGAAGSSGSSIPINGSSNDESQTITIITITTGKFSIFKLSTC